MPPPLPSHATLAPGLIGTLVVLDLCNYKELNLKFHSWLSGNAFVSGAGDLRFKFRAGQIGHNVANGSPPLQHFSERSCVARAQ